MLLACQHGHTACAVVLEERIVGMSAIVFLFHIVLIFNIIAPESGGCDVYRNGFLPYRYRENIHTIGIGNGFDLLGTGSLAVLLRVSNLCYYRNALFQGGITYDRQFFVV